MDRDELKKRIETAVGEWRDVSKRGPVTLGDNSCPVTGVPGFDSYSGVIATIQLSAELGIEIDRDNIFLTPDGKRARRISEVIDVIIGSGSV